MNGARTTTDCPGPERPIGDFEVALKEVDAAVATDLEWHLHPAHPHLFCGGCGSEAEECHPGECCTDVADLLGFARGVCDLCSMRRHTGQATPKAAS